MSILDRYILRQFIATFFFALLALCVIFLVVNLMEQLDTFLDKNAPAVVIATYYLNFLPEIIKLLAPISMLLASLFTIGKLANNNEITAMKSGGMSMYRLMFPLIFIAVMSSCAQYYFNGWIVPKSNQKKAEIERKYLSKAAASTSIYNLYFRDASLRNVVMQFYDNKEMNGSKISVENYSSEIQPRLTKRIDAETFRWDTVRSSWVIKSGLIHTFDEKGLHAEKFDSLYLPLNITPQELTRLQQSEDQMNFNELREFIDVSKRGGKDVSRKLIDYYGQNAFPFANFIVVLFGVPFSSGKRKSGLAVQMGAALAISFLYLAFTKIGQTIGYSLGIPPIISGWMANGVFFIAGIFTAWKMRS